ncbi:YncE family protein [Marinobacter sp. SS13-12]|uniref:cytochrome D1 domain-containing protein n=1 Tax=Marinobacter sp. SS13-12 TaxID=3050451 RepID=UPI002552B6A8|nr:YncE family protein [Marinobacter sp. SS13-12]MDK8463270.1 YncE family protein [Marinobacter sp. SS13-12]
MKHQLRKQWFGGLTAALLMGLSLAVSAGSSRAFIPMGSTDSIGVMDLESHRVTSTISGTVNTHGSALTPDGRYLIVGSLTAHDNQEPPVRPEAVTEDEHASHHGAQGGTVPKQPGTGRIYVVDTNTNEIDSVFEVPGPVHHVLVTGDGRYAVSTHPMDGGISVVDLDSGEVVEVIATGPSPNYIATTGDGQTLFVSNTGNGTVSEVDTRNWFVKRNVRTGGAPEHMALSPDEDHLYINDAAAGEALALMLSEVTVTARYEIGEAPHGLGLSADGQVLFATSQGDERIVRIELRLNSRESVQLTPAPYHLAVSPVDGQILVTSRGEAKLWVLDPVSLATVDEIPLDGIGHQISINAK